MKVVVVSSLAYSLVNFRGALLSAMVDAGHDVVACAPDEDADVTAALAARHVRFRQIPMQRASISPFADLFTLMRLIGLLRSERPDIVLAYTQKPIIYAGIAARLTGHSRFFAMVSGLGYAFSDGGGSRALRFVVAALYRLAVARADGLFVFNRDDGDEMHRNGILRHDQQVVQVPGSGVDLARFSARPVPDGPPVFLLVARLLRDKGLVEFADAAREVRKHCPASRFQILGPLDSNPTSIGADELAAWQAEGLVEYLGETRDVAPYLARSSVFVLPTYYREGLPRTILEAMATGRAIITTDAPGCRETVCAGENGFLVPVRDAAALAAAMQRIAREPGLAARMGARSRELAEQRFAVERVNGMLLGTMGLNNGEEGQSAEPAVASHPRTPLKRTLDIVASLTAGIILAPLVAAIGIAILAMDGRPVLFWQKRVGRDGRIFHLVKFRTMSNARDESGRLLDDEKRLTRLGRSLRRTRLDELPQLWNVLVGDMSLVGPRPLLPEWTSARGPAGQARATMRPGLTGWAQVNGNALLSDEDKLALDLWYIDHASLRTDLRILMRTVGVILHGERINQPEVRRAYAGDHRRGG